MDEFARLYRVSGVSRYTRAGRGVIDHETFGVNTARSGARVDAFIVAAGLAAVAVRIRDAFGSATGVRVPEIFR